MATAAGQILIASIILSLIVRLNSNRRIRKAQQGWENTAALPLAYEDNLEAYLKPELLRTLPQAAHSIRLMQRETEKVPTTAPVAVNQRKGENVHSAPRSTTVARDPVGTGPVAAGTVGAGTVGTGTVGTGTVAAGTVATGTDPNAVRTERQAYELAEPSMDVLGADLGSNSGKVFGGLSVSPLIQQTLNRIRVLEQAIMSNSASIEGSVLHDTRLTLGNLNFHAYGLSEQAVRLERDLKEADDADLLQVVSRLEARLNRITTLERGGTVTDGTEKRALELSIQTHERALEAIAQLETWQTQVMTRLLELGAVVGEARQAVAREKSLGKGLPKILEHLKAETSSAATILVEVESTRASIGYHLDRALEMPKEGTADAESGTSISAASVKPMGSSLDATPQKIGGGEGGRPEYHGVESSGVTASGVTAPGVTASGVTAFGVTAPGVTAPGVTASGVTASGGLAPLASEGDIRLSASKSNELPDIVDPRDHVDQKLEHLQALEAKVPKESFILKATGTLQGREAAEVEVSGESPRRASTPTVKRLG